MRKTTKILLGMFFSGALVCGVGCGVAFAELTGLEYTGVHTYGLENCEESQVVYEMAHPEGRVLLDDFGLGDASTWSFSYDEAVAPGTVVFDVCCDPTVTDFEVHSPELAVYENDYAAIGEGEYSEVVRVAVYSYRHGAYDAFSALEPFLAELREGKFGDYAYQGAKVDIRASADLEGRIDFLSSAMWG